MKLALITTTIHVPRVLELYRSMAPDVMFFVVGDRKTPHAETRAFVEGLGNAVYYSDLDQEKLGYECSEIIGWNKIMRRNIALLEALKHRPDCIVTIDDDNLPLNRHYFADFESLFDHPYNGLLAQSKTKWFNVGAFFTPSIHHRGFPYAYRHMDVGVTLSPVCGAKVGVAEGLWYGDPDVCAMERITNRPTIRHLSDVLHQGILVDGECFAPFNSQNTAYRAELAPLMLLWVGVGRYDDIWASYLAQRVMMETEYRVHVGKPFVWQERNDQSVWKNLKDELLGMEFTTQFHEALLRMKLGPGGILEKLHRLCEQLPSISFLPPVVPELSRAWLADLKKVGAQ